jgi:hypothetical protein
MGQLLRRLRAALKPLFVVVFWLTVVGTVVLLATPQIDKALGQTPRDWVQALRHPHPDVRAEAADRLLASGLPTVALLRETALSGDIDAAEPAIDLLRQMYRSTDVEIYQAVEKVFDELAETDNFRLRAYLAATRQRNSDLRLTRNLTAFEALGGVVRIDPKEFTGEQGPREAMTAVLDAEWTGGDEGLIHLHRLPKLRVVQVFRGARVSEAALDHLREQCPMVTVVRRGEACMGVAGIDRQSGFMVVSIEPGSGAERAGVRPQDVIVAFAGSSQVSYETIASVLFQGRPGDVVPVTVRRGESLVELQVPLGHYDPVLNSCPCQALR